jgi:hypothetical protein
MSNAEIATALLLGESTIKTHVGNLLSKLRLRDRVQLAIYAYESGLTRPGDGDLRHDPNGSGAIRPGPDASQPHQH